METATSEFLLIFHEQPERYYELSLEERRQALARWNAWCDELAAQGRLLHGNTLGAERRLVARPGRALDGPFTETKELIGGYLLLRAADLEEATAVAQTCPNLPYGMVVEVRPIARACSLARSLGWTTMRGPAEPAA
jgi:hypothetical protein